MKICEIPSKLDVCYQHTFLYAPTSHLIENKQLVQDD